VKITVLSNIDELMPWAWAARRSPASQHKPKARIGIMISPSKNQAVRAVVLNDRFRFIG
jgi:hypothetical protein